MERTKSQGSVRTVRGKDITAFWNLNTSASFKNELLKKNLNITVKKSNDVNEKQEEQNEKCQVEVIRELKDYRNPIIRRDVIQDQIIQNLIKQYNQDASKFTSPFIRMGAFLQQALAKAEN